MTTVENQRLPAFLLLDSTVEDYLSETKTRKRIESELGEVPSLSLFCRKTLQKLKQYSTYRSTENQNQREATNNILGARRNVVLVRATRSYVRTEKYLVDHVQATVR